MEREKNYCGKKCLRRVFAKTLQEITKNIGINHGKNKLWEAVMVKTILYQITVKNLYITYFMDKFAKQAL